MKRSDLTEKLLDIKREKGWSSKYICSQMYFQLQPFSRLMSSSFSVRSDRFMLGLP